MFKKLLLLGFAFTGLLTLSGCAVDLNPDAPQAVGTVYREPAEGFFLFGKTEETISVYTEHGFRPLECGYRFLRGIVCVSDDDRYELTYRDTDEDEFTNVTLKNRGETIRIKCHYPDSGKHYCVPREPRPVSENVLEPVFDQE